MRENIQKIKKGSEDFCYFNHLTNNQLKSTKFCSYKKHPLILGRFVFTHT